MAVDCCYHCSVKFHLVAFFFHGASGEAVLFPVLLRSTSYSSTDLADIFPHSSLPSFQKGAGDDLCDHVSSAVWGGWGSETDS